MVSHKRLVVIRECLAICVVVVLQQTGHLLIVVKGSGQRVQLVIVRPSKAPQPVFWGEQSVHYGRCRFQLGCP